MVSERTNAFLEMAEYARAVASVGEHPERHHGVERVRVDDMRVAFRLLQKGDPEAFRCIISEYATNGANAVAQLVSSRAEWEYEREIVNDPTDPVIMDVPPEARRS